MIIEERSVCLLKKAQAGRMNELVPSVPADFLSDLVGKVTALSLDLR